MTWYATKSKNTQGVVESLRKAISAKQVVAKTLHGYVAGTVAKSSFWNGFLEDFVLKAPAQGLALKKAKDCIAKASRAADDMDNATLQHLAKALKAFTEADGVCRKGAVDECGEVLLSLLRRWSTALADLMAADSGETGKLAPIIKSCEEICAEASLAFPVEHWVLTTRFHLASYMQKLGDAGRTAAVLTACAAATAEGAAHETLATLQAALSVSAGLKVDADAEEALGVVTKTLHHFLSKCYEDLADQDISEQLSVAGMLLEMLPSQSACESKQLKAYTLCSQLWLAMADLRLAGGEGGDRSCALEKDSVDDFKRPRAVQQMAMTAENTVQEITDQRPRLLKFIADLEVSDWIRARVQRAARVPQTATAVLSVHSKGGENGLSWSVGLDDSADIEQAIAHSNENMRLPPPKDFVAMIDSAEQAAPSNRGKRQWFKLSLPFIE